MVVYIVLAGLVLWSGNLYRIRSFRLGGGGGVVQSVEFRLV